MGCRLCKAKSFTSLDIAAAADQTTKPLVPGDAVVAPGPKAFRPRRPDVTPAPDTGLDLTAEERGLIRGTWDYIARDMDAVGVQIFLRIFDRRPAVKRLFPFRDVWGDALIRDPVFQAHAHRSVDTDCACAELCRFGFGDARGAGGKSTRLGMRSQEEVSGWVQDHPGVWSRSEICG